MTSSNGNSFRVTGHLCGEFTGPGEFPAQRPVTRGFDVFFDLLPDKRLSKQWWGWWFETPSHSLWRHRNMHKRFYATQRTIKFLMFLISTRLRFKWANTKSQIPRRTQWRIDVFVNLVIISVIYNFVSYPSPKHHDIKITSSHYHIVNMVFRYYTTYVHTFEFIVSLNKYPYLYNYWGVLYVSVPAR